MALESKQWYTKTDPEEYVIWYDHPSFIMTLPDILAGVIVMLGGGGMGAFVYTQTRWPVEVAYVMAAVSVVGFLYALLQYLVYKNVYYVVTTHRVMVKTDVIGRSTRSNQVEVVTDVHSSVTPLERLLTTISGNNIGDIKIDTANDAAGGLSLTNVPRVDLVHQHIDLLTSGENIAAQHLSRSDAQRDRSAQGKERQPQQQSRGRHTQSQRSAGARQGNPQESAEQQSQQRGEPREPWNNQNTRTERTGGRSEQNRTPLADDTKREK